jgi:predicted transcriptional regulator
LEILKEKGIVNGPIEVKGEGKGRPSILYKVNPALFSDVN